jgi:hypothetical protein
MFNCSMHGYGWFKTGIKMVNLLGLTELQLSNDKSNKNVKKYISLRCFTTLYVQCAASFGHIGLFMTVCLSSHGKQIQPGNVRIVEQFWRVHSLSFTYCDKRFSNKCVCPKMCYSCFATSFSGIFKLPPRQLLMEWRGAFLAMNVEIRVLLHV